MFYRNRSGQEGVWRSSTFRILTIWSLAAVAGGGLHSSPRGAVAQGVPAKSSGRIVQRRPLILSAGPMISERDIPNFHVVHPYLWRGAAPTEEGLRVLKASGVRTIIDLRISPKKVAAERRLVEAMGLRFINLPMSGDPPTTRQIETFLATSTSAEQQPVFIHCQHGADRTGTLLGIYRERVEGWDFDRAYKEMRRYGFDPRWRKLTATVRRYAPPDPARSRGGQERP